MLFAIVTAMTELNENYDIEHCAQS